MTEVSELDKQIDAVRPWIVRAAEALIGLFNEEHGVFWRSSFGVWEGDSNKHPTSTNRSFFALLEYLRYLEEEALYEDEKYSGPKVVGILQKVVESYFNLVLDDPNGLDLVRSSKSNKKNIFTDGFLLTSVALLERLHNTLKQYVNLEGTR